MEELFPRKGVALIFFRLELNKTKRKSRLVRGDFLESLRRCVNSLVRAEYDVFIRLGFKVCGFSALENCLLDFGCHFEGTFNAVASVLLPKEVYRCSG